MYKYRVHGINIASNLQLDCYSHNFETAELNLRFTKDIDEVHCYIDQLCKDEKPVMIEALSGQGKIYICGKNNIIIYYQSDYYLRHSMISYIYGFSFSYVLFMQKIFCLHGSSIALQNSATVLIGRPGAGKSTLAAGFARYGGRLLADDLTRIEVAADIPYVYASCPVRRLTKSSIEYLGLDCSDAAEIVGETEKYTLHDHHQYLFVDQNLPVNAIVCIAPSNTSEVHLVREDTKNSILRISNNIYNNGLLQKSELHDDYVDFVLTVCEKIPVYTLHRPQNTFTINEQVHAILVEIYKEDRRR